MFSLFSKKNVGVSAGPKIPSVTNSAQDCKMNEKDVYNFISVSAHQLKTPISAVKWSVEALINDDFKDEGEKKVLYEKMH
ncbi:MAG: hypothetical protein WCO30_01875, partial [bacterium]